ncbi:MAG: GIY-YIG nuclease family protein [Robiginitomaculum sp.]|nr:GIY-YIG nuclease family protein [Robiginitomaculum sp.]
MNAWVYILKCADGSFYVGSHRGPNIESRVHEHQSGFGGDYTRRRLPVKLMWCEHFQRITDTIASERQIKGWSRAKKQALIDGNWEKLSDFSRRRGGKPKA